MHWFLEQIENSFLEMKSVRSLSVCAMLTAMCVMLGMFHLPLGNSIQLSFGFLAMGLLGAWYGPVMAALCGGISDLLSFLLFPSGVFFLFISIFHTSIIPGVIDDMFLSPKNPLIWLL